MHRSQPLDWYCEPLDFSDSYDALLAAKLSYCYYALKILDLFDTVFFVLRKKGTQISFLHVYPHVAVLLASFIGVSFAPGQVLNALTPYTILYDRFFASAGGHAWFFGLMNCFVHVVMYAYYFGSVYSPALKQNLFVKKTITQMQIVSINGHQSKNSTSF